MDVSVESPLPVVFLSKMPSPYMVEFFNELQRQGKCAPFVLYLTSSIPDRPWDSLPVHHSHLILDAGWHVWREAMKRVMGAPLVVFSYYTHLFCVIALYRRWLMELPFVYWGERPGFFQLGWLGRMIRRVLLLPLHRSPVPIWGVGKFGIEGYRKEFGGDRSYVNMPYASDLEPYRAVRRPRPDAKATAGRERRFLFSGAFIHRKGIVPLAKAFVILAQELSDVRLILMGDGPLRPEVERILKPVADKVVWKGFVAWHDLPKGYAEGDILCLPSSYDGWGMVVVEALAAGMPVIATRRIGAALEMVEEGETGWCVTAGHPKELLHAMREAAVADDETLARMRERGRSRVAEHDVRAAAPRLAQAAKAALDHALIRPDQVDRDGVLPKRVLLVANYLPDQQFSMQRYASLLETGLVARGMQTTVVRPMALVGWLGLGLRVLRKELGYVDKFVIFPLFLRIAALRCAGQGGVIHLLDQGNGVYLQLLADLPHVVTCHDLIAAKASTQRSWAGQGTRIFKQSQYQKLNVRALSGAAWLACVSKATRDDCVAILGVAQERCALVYNPIDPFFLEESTEGAPESLPPHYLLHVGNSGWYKNRMGLLRIYSELRQLGCDLPLVLMGGELSPHEIQLMRDLEVELHVVSAVLPEDATVRAAYAHARALIFPSWDEGFGWPIVEAQAQGCPVFATDKAPMTEAGGEICWYIDPADPASAAALIWRELSKDARHPSLEAARKAHAASFTMSRFIDGCLDLYRQAVVYRVAYESLHPQA